MKKKVAAHGHGYRRGEPTGADTNFNAWTRQLPISGEALLDGSINLLWRWFWGKEKDGKKQEGVGDCRGGGAALSPQVATKQMINKEKSNSPLITLSRDRGETSFLLQALSWREAGRKNHLRKRGVV